MCHRLTYYCYLKNDISNAEHFPEVIYLFLRQLMLGSDQPHI